MIIVHNSAGVGADKEESWVAGWQFWDKTFGLFFLRPLLVIVLLFSTSFQSAAAPNKRPFAALLTHGDSPQYTWSVARR